jgi:hypothetical protein
MTEQSTEIPDDDLDFLEDEEGDRQPEREPTSEQIETLKSLTEETEDSDREVKDPPEKQSERFDYFHSQFSAIRNRTLIARVLDGRTSYEREQILRTAYEADIKGDDPLFAVLLATGQLEFLLNKKPDELDRVFKDWQVKWNYDLKYADALFEQHSSKLRHYINETEEKLKLHSQAALDVQSKNISDSVNHLVKKAAFEKVAHDAYALICAGTVLLGAVGIGCVLGLAMPRFFKPALDPIGARQLTLEEAKALDWGMSESGRFARNNPELIRWIKSSQGQYARKFMTWNQNLLGGRDKFICERDVEQLGVTLRLEGKEAKSGYCTLWTRSPEERRFIK